MDWNSILNGKNVYRTQYPDGTAFYWRLLTIAEYRILNVMRARGDFHLFDLHSKIWDLCVLNKAEFHKHLPLGMITGIGAAIMYLSGDCEEETLKSDIDQMRSMYAGNAVREVMIKTILTAFAMYKLEDVDKWDRVELIEKFVLAESALIFRGMKINQLDTSKIRSQSDLIQQQAVSKSSGSGLMNIDFNADSAALMKEQNPLDIQDAFNQEYDTREKLNKKLSPDHAKALSRR